MSGLQDIASHLHGKTEAYRHHASGVLGQTSEVENQMIEHLSGLRQQVSVLTDVVQALLQIIAEDHEQRISQRAKRRLRWIWENVKKCGQKVWVRMVLKILGAIGIAGTLWLIIARMIHFFHGLRR